MIKNILAKINHVCVKFSLILFSLVFNTMVFYGIEKGRRFVDWHIKSAVNLKEFPLK
jgi:hypothetical protein